MGLADMMQSNNLTSPNIGMFVRGDISERTEHPPIGVFVCSMFEFDNEWRAVLTHLMEKVAIQSPHQPRSSDRQAAQAPRIGMRS